MLLQAELMTRRLDDVRLAVLMLDGIELKRRTNVVALGITTEGVKIPLGLWEGSTENATVATCESMIECVRRSSRNVKRWQSGEMCLRWTAAGMLEAERQFRRIIGYHDLAKLCVAIDNERERTTPPTPTEEAAIVLTRRSSATDCREIPRRTGHPPRRPPASSA